MKNSPEITLEIKTERDQDAKTNRLKLQATLVRWTALFKLGST